MTKKKTKDSEEFVSHAEDPLLSPSECGLLVGRSAQTIRRHIADKILRAHRDPTGRFRIRKSALVRVYMAIDSQWENDDGNA